eukprot:2635644-Rhodomonas_salina.1
MLPDGIAKYLRCTYRYLALLWVVPTDLDPRRLKQIDPRPEQTSEDSSRPWHPLDPGPYLSNRAL